MILREVASIFSAHMSNASKSFFGLLNHGVTHAVTCVFPCFSLGQVVVEHFEVTCRVPVNLGLSQTFVPEMITYIHLI